MCVPLQSAKGSGGSKGGAGSGKVAEEAVVVVDHVDNGNAHVAAAIDGLLPLYQYL
jgi:hypothetical protein